MRKDIIPIARNLENAPDILERLLADIPEGRLKQVRQPGKWSAHSHACHLAVAQPMLLQRFRRFEEEAEPVFKPYFPDKEAGDEALLGMDLAASLASFRDRRRELMERVSKKDDPFWDKPAIHPEYDQYTPLIMIRHIMMHDYLHMYRIEELWLTRSEFLPG
jgi:hypothetical protein